MRVERVCVPPPPSRSPAAAANRGGASVYAVLRRSSSCAGPPSLLACWQQRREAGHHCQEQQRPLPRHRRGQHQHRQSRRPAGREGLRTRERRTARRRSEAHPVAAACERDSLWPAWPRSLSRLFCKLFGVLPPRGRRHAPAEPAQLRLLAALGRCPGRLARSSARSALERTRPQRVCGEPLLCGPPPDRFVARERMEAGVVVVVCVRAVEWCVCAARVYVRAGQECSAQEAERG